ncbi:MAG: hypothetical protein Q9162_000404 [Coniocarpon cinnabarinum]
MVRHPSLGYHNWMYSNVGLRESHPSQTADHDYRVRHYRSPRRLAVSESLPLQDVPHITIIRPLRGLEPCLYECLASTFRLSYPQKRTSIHFCVSSRDDPAIPIVKKLLKDFPDYDAKLFIEEEDEEILSHPSRYGPNPKIRNMSRAYREAGGDLVWILDCNVWVSRGTAGNMVDTIDGLSFNGHRRKYKLVHQLPVVVDVTSEMYFSTNNEDDGVPAQAVSTSTSATAVARPVNPSDKPTLDLASLFYGGRLEEMFLSTSHAKMYVGINTIKVSPCILGKSNMFRRSHLNAMTRNSPKALPEGIDYFSFNICEDHLVGDILWKNKVPMELGQGTDFGSHAMVFGDLAIQPMAGMSLKEYIARRVRWQRVRKFTVPKATVTEPGTESFLASFYFAFCLTTCSGLDRIFGIPQTWSSFALIWTISMCTWIVVDWFVSRLLQAMKSVEVNEGTPTFVQPRHRYHHRRTLGEWFLAWLGREMLALPIWFIAVFGGVTVIWRGKKFKVGMDMCVHPIDPPGHTEDLQTFSRSNSSTPDDQKLRRE